MDTGSTYMGVDITLRLVLDSTRSELLMLFKIYYFEYILKITQSISVRFFYKTFSFAPELRPEIELDIL